MFRSEPVTPILVTSETEQAIVMGQTALSMELV